MIADPSIPVKQNLYAILQSGTFRHFGEQAYEKFSVDEPQPSISSPVLAHLTTLQLGCSGGLAEGCAPTSEAFLRGSREEKRALKQTISLALGAISAV